MTLDKSQVVDSDTKRLTVYLFSKTVTAGNANLVFTPAAGQAHEVIEVAAQVIESLADNAADVSQSNSGGSVLPVSMSTGTSSAETTEAQTTVIAAFGIHSDQQPVSWVWGSRFTTLAQDERSYAGGAMTALTTAARKLNTVQTVAGTLNPVSGVANAIYAGVVVAYR